MKKRSIIVIGILVVAIALVTVPLVLAGDGANSFSRNAAAAVATPSEGVQGSGSISITHSASQAITALNSVSCNAGGLHADNAYLRRFTLADFGITGGFNVTDVEIGIEQAAGANGSQPATFNIYLWDPNDSFTYANFTEIATTDVVVNDGALTKMTFPVSANVPAGSTFVVEFFTPDGQTAGHSLFVGSNAAGQTDDTFLAAAACGITEPTPTSGIGFPDMMLVMNVWGDEAAEPDMFFDKTVGLDPNECALDGELSVPAGGGGVDVTYCYWMENTGAVTFTYHTVEDDQLGTLLGPDFVATVAPGSAVYFTVTALITETTTNVATWSITDGDLGVIISATDSATVTQMPPTSVSLSGFDVQSSNWLAPIALVAIVTTLFGAAFVLRRRSVI